MSDTKVIELERRIDRDVAEQTIVGQGGGVGGIRLETMDQVFEFSKMMAISGPAVRPHWRGNPGLCLATCIQAIEWATPKWRPSPFAVANKTYVVVNKGVESIAYESQLVHAIIEAHAPIEGRLRARYEGEGDERVCIVYATFKGEAAPHEWRSPPLKQRHPGHVVKEGARYSRGSPLWDTKPDLQLFYDTSRDWARAWCPDILIGVYAVDEFPVEAVQHEPDPTAALSERLKLAQGEANHTTDGASKEIDGAKPADETEGKTKRGRGRKGKAQEPTEQSEPKAASEPSKQREPGEASEPHGPREPKGPSEPSHLRGPDSESEPARASAPKYQSEPTRPSEPLKESEPSSLREPLKTSEPDSPSAPPRSSDEYLVYARSWIDAWQLTGDELRAKFNSKDERSLRATCGVMADELVAIRSRMETAAQNAK